MFVYMGILWGRERKGKGKERDGMRKGKREKRREGGRKKGRRGGEGGDFVCFFKIV